MTYSTRDFIATDIGASNGKVFRAAFNGHRLNITEVYRFENGPVQMLDTICWDFPRLFSEVLAGIGFAARAAKPNRLQSVGIDTWGIDFGLLNRRGRLLSNPVCYRDPRTTGLLKKISAIIPDERLFEMTGTVIMEINTLFQLYSMKLNDQEMLDCANRLLLMPDLINYFLTGEVRAEYTNASTTQCCDIRNGGWNFTLLNELDLPVHLFPEIIKPSSVSGSLLPELCESIGVHELKVVSVGSHDTASALAGMPVLSTQADEDWAFLIMGTWAIIGAESPQPILSLAARRGGFTNEGFLEDRFSFFRFFSGLWLIQEYRKSLAARGKTLTWEEMAIQAMEAGPFQTCIDITAPCFISPSADLRKTLSDYFIRTGQRVPDRDCDFIRSIYEGTVLQVKQSFDELKQVTGRRFSRVFLSGGGSQSKMLCRFISDALGCTVICGVPECTALGNVVSQMIACGEIKDVRQGRDLVWNSFELETFLPVHPDAWDEALQNAHTILCSARLATDLEQAGVG